MALKSLNKKSKSYSVRIPLEMHNEMQEINEKLKATGAIYDFNEDVFKALEKGLDSAKKALEDTRQGKLSV